MLAGLPLFSSQKNAPKQFIVVWLEVNPYDTYAIFLAMAYTHTLLKKMLCWEQLLSAKYNTWWVHHFLHSSQLQMDGH